jgi:uncharacterized protein (DUF488 family)
MRSSKKVLYTIGYQGLEVGGLLSILKTALVEVVIDVRAIPLSRKAGFSKSALSSVLGESKIEYLHLKGLGDPREGREAARAGEYKRFKRIYGVHLGSEVAKNDMNIGLETATNARACLLCFERDFRVCHRYLVAQELCRRRQFSIIHLEGHSPSSIVTKKLRHAKQESTSVPVQ